MRGPLLTCLTLRVRALSSLWACQYMGMGQNLTTKNWTTGFGPCFHLPGFHLRVTLFLTATAISYSDYQARPARNEVKSLRAPYEPTGFFKVGFGSPVAHRTWGSKWWTPFGEYSNNHYDAYFDPHDPVPSFCLYTERFRGASSPNSWTREPPPKSV